jgi:maleate isomerase
MTLTEPAAQSPATRIRFDQGRNPRARIGYVLLATEQIVESDVTRLVPDGVAAHISRAAMPNEITVANLRANAAGLAEAAGRITPNVGLDVICYACTSGSLIIGEEAVFAELRKGAPGAKATSMVTGVVRALRTLEARRIVVATPYLDEINELEAAYLDDLGFEVLDLQGLNIEADNDIARVTPDFIAEFAASLDRPDADAVFVSCGALRTVDVVGDLEAGLRKPVICSNQAMIWDTLRLAGITDPIGGYGRILMAH